MASSSSPASSFCCSLCFLHLFFPNLLLHYIPEPSLWSSSFPPPWQFHLQHPLSTFSSLALLPNPPPPPMSSANTNTVSTGTLLATSAAALVVSPVLNWSGMEISFFTKRIWFSKGFTLHGLPDATLPIYWREALGVDWLVPLPPWQS